jgi:light-regulated signal transduction histidine kinase (bacteriophytochrome)
MRRQAAVLGVVLLIALGVAFLIARKLERSLSAPILRLATTARQVTDAKDYSLRAAGDTGDELGALVRAFNEMLEQIQTRDAELLRGKAQLEERVKERTEELLERNVELARTNQDLDDFAYIASHDLKEPLRGIHNYASFLLEDYQDRLEPEGKEQLQTLVRLTKMMEGIIDSLLEYSRVRRTELLLTTVDLNDLVAEVLESLAIVLREGRVSVKQAADLPTLTCDRVRVAEVFRNLISNAMKYNDKPEKKIEIGSIPDPQRPVLYVRDNGIGIAEKHRDSIFQMFKRLHARDKFGGGTGAGLAIVKKIIERHQGEIWLESTPGEGTTFYFTLSGVTQ